MAKDPAFLFYPNDYIGGTMGMTLEEKGAYVELLMLQFNKGAFTIKQAQKVLGNEFERLWSELKEKFVEENEKFFNKRLEQEREKRADNAKKNKERIEKYWDSKKKNTDGNSNVYTKPIPIKEKPIENENEIRNENINSDEEFGKSENLFIVPQMCDLWYKSFPTYTKNKQNDYAGMGKIVQFMHSQSSISDISDTGLQIKILNTLQLIADQVNREPFWVNKPIKSIANNIQEFYNHIKNPLHDKGNNKKHTNAFSREGVQAKLNERLNQRQQT